MKLITFIAMMMCSSLAHADVVLKSMSSCRCDQPYLGDSKTGTHGICNIAEDTVICKCESSYQTWGNSGGVFYCLPECPGDMYRKDYDTCAVAMRAVPQPLELGRVPTRSRPASNPGLKSPSKQFSCNRDPRGNECLSIARKAIEEQNWNLAESYLRLICRAGDAIGCRALAEVAVKASLPTQRKLEALQLLNVSCDHGDPDSCLDLARIHASGELSKVDEPARKNALDRACTRGSADACLARGDAERDQAKALKYFEQACEGRSAEACQNLAVYYNRIDSEVAILQAAVYAKKACNLSVSNCFVLAYMLFSGKSIPRDIKTALKLLGTSCKLHNSYACELAATTDSRLYERTADLVAKLCDAGEMGECVRLAEMYGGGYATPHGSSGARSLPAPELVRRACYKHTSGACRDLAFYYADGAEGVRKDRPQAERLFTAECNRGDKTSCRWLKELPARSSSWLEGPIGLSLGAGVTQIYRTIKGEHADPIFGITLGGGDVKGDLLDDSSNRLHGEAQIRFQSSFSRWQEFAIGARGGFNIISKSRADRSAPSLLNLSLGVDLGAQIHDGLDLGGWLGAYLSETAFFSCGIALRGDLGYQWWGGNTHGLGVSVGLVWWFDRRMTGINHDSCNGGTLRRSRLHARE